jgi:uncharacterized protein (TIGR03382 family)
MHHRRRRLSTRPFLASGLLAALGLFSIAAPATSQARSPAPEALRQLERRLQREGRFPQLHLIRFDGPIRPAQRAALRRAGVRVLEALPPHGWLVSGRPQPAGPQLDGARIEPLHLADKLAPELFALLDGTPSTEVVELRAATLLGRSPAAAAAALRPLVLERDGLTAVQDAAGRGLLWLRLAPEHAGAALQRLSAHPDVLWVEPTPRLAYSNDNSSWLIQSGKREQGRTIWRRGLTGWGQVVAVADSGLDADACQFRYGPERAAVTLADDALQPPAAAVMEPDNKVLSYYVIGAADAYDDATGGFHGTHTVGDVAGDDYAHLATATAAGHDPQDGMAPGARIVFQDIGSEDGALRGLQGVSMTDLLLQAYDTGARIHSDSYGSAIISVRYDADAAAIDQAAWELGDLLVVFAAGNSGADQDGNPQIKSLGGTGSVAKNSLVVGASGPVELQFYGSTYELANDLLFFSSQGPTADGRLKPDLVAPGMVFSATTDTATLERKGCCDINGDTIAVTNNEDDNCNVDRDWPTFGTSFSAPIAAGAAALARQYYTDGYWQAGRSAPESGFNPTNALLKATLIAGAEPLIGTIVGMGQDHELTFPPSYEQGWGRLNLDNALWFTDEERHSLLLDDVPNPVSTNPMLEADPPPYPDGGQPLVTGDQRDWFLPSPAGGRVIKVALAWSDPPAAPGAERTLVNDLDLEVESPAGDIYLGNREYDGLGFSQPSWQMTRDDRNNVEVVTLKSAAAGWWQVRLIARSVDGNGQAGSDAQGYALVAVGEFDPPVPEAMEPHRIAPGEQLEQVELQGSDFVPGMRLSLGPGVEVEGLEVHDARRATIARLSVDAEAVPGPRDGVLRLYNLTGAGEALLQVGGGGGCSCGAPLSAAPALPMAGLLLLVGLLLRRRRSQRCR